MNTEAIPHKVLYKLIDCILMSRASQGREAAAKRARLQSQAERFLSQNSPPNLTEILECSFPINEVIDKRSGCDPNSLPSASLTLYLPSSIDGSHMQLQHWLVRVEANTPDEELTDGDSRIISALGEIIGSAQKAFRQRDVQKTAMWRPERLTYKVQLRGQQRNNEEIEILTEGGKCFSLERNCGKVRIFVTCHLREPSKEEREHLKRQKILNEEEQFPSLGEIRPRFSEDFTSKKLPTNLNKKDRKNSMFEICDTKLGVTYVSGSEKSFEDSPRHLVREVELKQSSQSEEYELLEACADEMFLEQNFRLLAQFKKRACLYLE